MLWDVRIGQEKFGFAIERGQGSLSDRAFKADRLGADRSRSSSDFPRGRGEPAWPPLPLFKAMPLSIWYDLSDAKLAEALDYRRLPTLLRPFCFGADAMHGPCLISQSACGARSGQNPVR